ncbi:MAG: ABC transporter permease [Lachnospiraceae bacterium]|nr:ABC transporter permease [Lachnospiraceae bacterium]MDE7238271.1 ABC transporter permease [Lachnospiraceae bacterium]
MRAVVFAGRNAKELLRDPISYIFCLGFPLVMLAIMTVLNENIPPEANMVIFRIDYLSSGIAVFGLTFVMLFTCLQIAKDRSSAFLLRLYASPMTAAEFIIGYILPILVIAVLQSVITYAVSVIIGAVTGYSFVIGRMFLAMLVLLPADFLFIGFGLLFGTVFSEKAAPGLCSVIISVSAILGGIWMDVGSLSGGFQHVCEALPFYHIVEAAREAVRGDLSRIASHMLIVMAYTIVVFMVSVFLFAKKRQQDLR